jgi:repressor LexA
MERAFTETQSQYLAFTYYYGRIHGVPPAEADMERYFRVSALSVHNRVVTMEKRGFIRSTPGEGRAIQLLLTRDQLPDLR